jgi:hypothetical protein
MSEWSVCSAKSFSSIPLGRSRCLVIAFQMASIRGLPKSEAMTIMNVRGNGTVPCGTIKLLIHTFHVVLRRRDGDTTRGQLKQSIAIEQRR